LQPGQQRQGEILEQYPYLEEADVRGCLVDVRRVVGHERVEPAFVDSPD